MTYRARGGNFRFEPETPAVSGAMSASLRPACVPVRRDILASWQRSMAAGLKPDRFEVPYVADADDVAFLSTAAAPVIDEAAADLDGTGTGLLLTDARGHVIERRTPDHDVTRRLDRIELAPGFLYAEDQVGTNAIGTAIAQRAPSVVTGSEHFADALGRMACAAAPVTDVSGKLIGVVDLTCEADRFNPLMLPMAKRVAREVGQQVQHVSRAAAVPGWATLTFTERTVAELVTQGLTSRAAANRLRMSPDIVDLHLRRIFRKLGIRTRTELARITEAAAEQERTMAAVDNARRRIERDLHDGLQQQLVALGLQVRAAELSVPDSEQDLKWELAGVASGLLDAMSNVREIARGIHPAILTERGLVPAVKALARHSPVPVSLDVRVPGRLPARVEAGAYYILSETLANVAKHSKASGAEVSVVLRRGFLSLSVRDDGVGGADPRGAGLAGLRERVVALGGTLELTSPRAGGTRLVAAFPAGVSR